MIKKYITKPVTLPEDMQKPYYHRLPRDFDISNMEIGHGTSMPYFHYHNVYELFYMKQGTKRYVIKGVAYDLAAHDLVIVRPGEIHRSVSCDNTEQHRVILYFSEQFFDRFADVIGKHSLFECLQRPQYTIPARFRLRFDKLIERISSMDHEDMKDDINCAAMQGWMFEMLVMLSEIASISQRQVTDNEIVTRTIQYIQKNYMNSLTLADAAKEVFVSSSYLSALFRSCMGTNFNSYVQELRIRQAIERLTSSDDSISEVAAACGFSSPNYFKDAFKRVTGRSPSAYRREALTEEYEQKCLRED
ncbi:MAG: helix-turn-helix transcriptional regulator [Clostridia bacterium]|nr:helix-turn-helix transcriptional regulator [Clostridia bacterium]